MKVLFPVRVFFFIALLSFPPALAQTQEVSSIFWKVSAKDNSKPTYLFGTHHLHNFDFIEDNPIIDASLEQADIVVGEVVIDPNDLSIVTKLASKMRLENNSLDRLLTEAQYKATDACLRKYMGFGIQPFNSFKPIFIYQLIMVAKYMKSQDEESSQVPGMMDGTFGNSMDVYFQEEGKKQEKKIQGLETVDQQLSVLIDGYSLERQVEMLMEMVEDKSEGGDSELEELDRLYNQQNLSGLFELMQKSTPAEELQKLLIDRNINWIPQIEKIINNQQSAFIAVGAGHLPGPYGLIKLLRQKGYTLEPIKISVSP
ncbi:MAG: TraB/GumN family protein [Bacteroidota bacterium]